MLNLQVRDLQAESERWRAQSIQSTASRDQFQSQVDQQQKTVELLRLQVQTAEQQKDLLGAQLQQQKETISSQLKLQHQQDLAQLKTELQSSWERQVQQLATQHSAELDEQQSILAQQDQLLEQQKERMLQQDTTLTQYRGRVSDLEAQLRSSTNQSQSELASEQQRHQLTLQQLIQLQLQYDDIEQKFEAMKIELQNAEGNVSQHPQFDFSTLSLQSPKAIFTSPHVPHPTSATASSSAGPTAAGSDSTSPHPTSAPSTSSASSTTASALSPLTRRRMRQLDPIGMSPVLQQYQASQQNAFSSPAQQRQHQQVTDSHLNPDQHQHQHYHPGKHLRGQVADRVTEIEERMFRDAEHDDDDEKHHHQHAHHHQNKQQPSVLPKSVPSHYFRHAFLVVTASIRINFFSFSMFLTVFCSSTTRCNLIWTTRSTLKTSRACSPCGKVCDSLLFCLVFPSGTHSCWQVLAFLSMFRYVFPFFQTWFVRNNWSFKQRAWRAIFAQPKSLT